MKTSRYSYLTMFGHICCDINQGALPAILPFLIANSNISYASAAGLVFAATSISSLVQPLFGWLGDRVSWPWLMSIGILLAGIGIAMIGMLEHYWAIFFCAMLSGIGIALFHPEGGRIAHLAAGEKKAAGMSIFSVGGNIGFALGPVIVSAALSLWGLRGTFVFLVPSTLMAVIILANVKKLNSLSASNSKNAQADNAGKKDDWPAFLKLTITLTFRSIVSYGLLTFIPLYLIGVFGQTKASANTRLTVFSITGAVATLAGARLAERYGFARIIKITCTALLPLLLLFIATNSIYVATFLIVPVAFALNGPHSTMVALGQEFLPNRVGLSSGISLGLAVSVGGMVSPAFGWMGDHYGLTTALYAIAGAAVVILVFAWLVPSRRQAEEEKPARQVGSQL